MGAGETTFGPFVVDRSSGTLLRDGRPVAIGQRGYALLQALLDADGVVSKAQLMEAGWPGTIVEEGNLTVQIAALRKALGAREDGREWIVTVPRVGYRLLRGGAISDAAIEVSHVPSVAVLPFSNMSGDPEQDYFADGIVEDIITALSRFKSMLVLARQSSFALKERVLDMREAARELGVRYVLEGSVRRGGARLRITAQLVDGATGVQLWADNFDGALDEVFAFQDRITESVVAFVEPMVTRSEIERAHRKPPSSLGAYDLYLQALALVLATEPGANARAIDLIERSLAIDPSFAPALAVAANAHMTRSDRQQPGASESERVKGLGYAHAALAAAGTDANTRAIAGLAVIMLGREYETGLAALQRAAAENPNSVNVLSYAAVGALWGGELEDAERLFLRCIRLNVGDLGGHWLFSGMAHVRIAEERYEDAIAWATRAHAASPTNEVALWFLAAANAKLGRMDDAVRWRQAIETLTPASTLESIRRGQGLRDSKRIDHAIEGLRLAGLRQR